MGEKESQTCVAAQHVWKKRKREKDEPVCVRKHTICVTHFMAFDWSRRYMCRFVHFFVPVVLNDRHEKYLFLVPVD
jgi:hypothetical protein